MVDATTGSPTPSTRPPDRFDRAADRWRGLYREALTELDDANDGAARPSARPKPAKRGAAGRIAEARAALDLLRGRGRRRQPGRLLHLPLLRLARASCPATPSRGCRWRRSSPASGAPSNGQGDYLQRPRFLAISEFGPGAFIYHEGARYEVNRVSLPARDDGTGVDITEIKRCDACGYLHDSNGTDQRRDCASTAAAARWRRMSQLMRLQTVKTRRRDRISADEEERQRAGYEIVTTLRFGRTGCGPANSPAPSPATATQLGTHDLRRHRPDLADERRAAPPQGQARSRAICSTPREGTVGAKTPTSTKNDVTAEDAADTAGRPLRRGPPQRPAAAPGPGDRHRSSAWPLMYALKRAIEAVFQLESSELAVEPLPGRTGDHAWSRLLFFEAAEGGAGVLRRLATEDGQLRRRGPEGAGDLHFDPDTGADRHRAEHAREDCAQACYDCLLSYGNQCDHQHLDRHSVAELLAAARRARRSRSAPAARTAPSSWRG